MCSFAATAMVMPFCHQVSALKVLRLQYSALKVLVTAIPRALGGYDRSGDNVATIPDPGILLNVETT